MLSHLVSDLVRKIVDNFAFSEMNSEDITQIVEHLISRDFLERLNQEVIVGLTGERIVHGKDFYSVFKSEENFRVVSKGVKIGEIPYSPQIIVNENILLAAKIWKIKYVDDKSKLTEVIPAKDGKKPIFFGGGVEVHAMVRQKMMEIIFSSDSYDYIDKKGADRINEIRNEFQGFEIGSIVNQRPIKVKPNCLELYSFTSTRINRTLKLLTP